MTINAYDGYLDLQPALTPGIANGSIARSVNCVPQPDYRRVPIRRVPSPKRPGRRSIVVADRLEISPGTSILKRPGGQFGHPSGQPPIALAYSAAPYSAADATRGVTGLEVADGPGARRRSEQTARPWLAKSRLSWRAPRGN